MGLRKVYATQSLSDFIWYYLVYSEARLLNDENAKEYAAKITALIKEVEVTWQGQRTAWRAEIAAQAKVDAANYHLDHQTKRFARILLSQEDIALNTNHPRYKRYFSIALSRIVKLALEPQIKITRPWLESIKTEGEAAVRAFFDIFTGIVHSGEEALKNQEKATGARKDHRVRDINSLVKRINDTCQEIYGALKAKAPSLNLPPEWVDGFFYSPRNAAAPDAAALYQESIYNVCKARSLDVSEVVGDKLDETKDLVMLQGWLSKAMTVAHAEEIVGLPVPTEE
jgi:hypothetical protein